MIIADPSNGCVYTTAVMPFVSVRLPDVETGIAQQSYLFWLKVPKKTIC